MGWTKSQKARQKVDQLHGIRWTISSIGGQNAGHKVDQCRAQSGPTTGHEAEQKQDMGVDQMQDIR